MVMFIRNGVPEVPRVGKDGALVAKHRCRRMRHHHHHHFCNKSWLPQPVNSTAQNMNSTRKEWSTYTHCMFYIAVWTPLSPAVNVAKTSIWILSHGSYI